MGVRQVLYVFALLCLCDKRVCEIFLMKTNFFEKGGTTIIVVPFEDKVIMEEQIFTISLRFSFLDEKLCIIFCL